MEISRSLPKKEIEVTRVDNAKIVINDNNMVYRDNWG